MENEKEKVEVHQTVSIEDLKNLLVEMRKEFQPTEEKSVDDISKIKGIEKEFTPSSDNMNVAFKQFVPIVKNRNMTEVSKILDAASGGDGVALVPSYMGDQISYFRKEYGIAASDCYNFNMTGNTLTVPRESTEASGSWITENNQKGTQNYAFETVTFTRHDFVLMHTLTNQLLEDSSFDVLGYLTERAGEKIAYAEDYQLFRGTGSPIYGITSGSLVPRVNLDSTWANAITGSGLYQKLATMVGTPSSSLSDEGQAWYMNRTAYGDLLSCVTTTGQPYVTYEGGTPYLFGFPVKTTNVLPRTTITTAGTRYVVFGNMSKGAWVGRRKSMNITVSDTAYVAGASMFEYNATAVRIEDSKDINVIQPNNFVILRSSGSVSE